WWVFIIPLVLLHVSLGRRWYYMLPVMGPMTLLMAWSGMSLARMLINDGRIGLWRSLGIAHIVVLIAALAWLQRTAPSTMRPPTWAPWTLLAVAGLALAAMMRAGPQWSSVVGMAAPIAVGVVFLIGAADRATLWNIERRED